MNDFRPKEHRGHALRGHVDYSFRWTNVMATFSLFKWATLLVFVMSVGCQQAAPPNDTPNNVRSPPQKHEPDTKASAFVVSVMPAMVDRKEGAIDLADLGLVLLKVNFNDPIGDNSSIFFSETEITNKMYAVYLADTNQKRDDSKLEWESQDRNFSTASPVIHVGNKSALWRDGTFPDVRKDHPVSLVTTGEAMEFCKWLTARYQLDGSFRLPTDEEWLFAAYGKDRQYPWGNERKEWTGTATEPVKARPELRTPSGLYGMWGNASELVLSSSNGYGGKVKDIYTPFITVWLGGSYKDEMHRGKSIQPRQDDWGYTHSRSSRSDEWGFRVVFVPQP
jgi:hypothetical protein